MAVNLCRSRHILEKESSHRFPRLCFPTSGLCITPASSTPPPPPPKEKGESTPGQAAARSIRRTVRPSLYARAWAAGTSGFLLVSEGDESVRQIVGRRMSPDNGQLSGEPVVIADTAIRSVGAFVMSTSPAGVIARLAGCSGRSAHLGRTRWPGSRVRRPTLDPVWCRESPTDRMCSPREAAKLDDELRAYGADSRGPRPPRCGRLMAHALSAITIRMWRHRVPCGHSTISGATETTSGPYVTRAMGWLSDGRVIWIRSRPDAPSEIWARPPNGKPEVILQDGSDITEARVSPDGRWIAYATNRSGRFEIEVRELAADAKSHPVSVDGGGYPRWRKDGRELYYLSADGRLKAVASRPEPRQRSAPTRSSSWRVSLTSTPMNS